MLCMYSLRNSWQEYVYGRRCKVKINKKDWKERLINFFDTKGFYIIVVVCLFVIGFSIYTIATTDFMKYEVEEKQDNNVSLNNSDTSNAIPQVGMQEVTKQDKLKNSPATTEKNRK